MSKQSDSINNYRIFPRLFAILYALLVWWTAQWFMGLENPSAEQAAFVSAIGTASAAYFKFYVQSGPQTKSSKE